MYVCNIVIIEVLCMKKPVYNDVIDFQRALLIVMVILVHIVNFGTLYPEVKARIFSFFMPAFLIITGYLVNIRKPPRQFGVYLLQMAIPYTIMVIGYMVLSLYLPVRDGITELSWETTFRILFIRSIGPYWFFRVIIICSTLYYIVFKCADGLKVRLWKSKAGKEDAAKIGELFVLLATLFIVSRLTPALPWDTAFYFVCGVTIRLLVHDFDKVCPRSWLACVPFTLFLYVYPKDLFNVSVLILVFCFFSLTAQLSTVITGRFRLALLYIGRNTLPIYIFHPVFTMAGKFLLPIFQFDKSGLCHAGCVTLLALLGSIAIARVADKLHCSWIMGRAKLLR